MAVDVSLSIQLIWAFLNNLLLQVDMQKYFFSKEGLLLFLFLTDIYTPYKRHGNPLKPSGQRPSWNDFRHVCFTAIQHRTDCIGGCRQCSLEIAFC